MRLGEYTYLGSMLVSRPLVYHATTLMAPNILGKGVLYGGVLGVTVTGAFATFPNQPAFIDEVFGYLDSIHGAVQSMPATHTGRIQALEYTISSRLISRRSSKREKNNL